MLLLLRKTCYLLKQNIRNRKGRGKVNQRWGKVNQRSINMA